MTECPTDNAQYFETIKTIVLRDTDGITIPKDVRETAFELSIDIIVRSIARQTGVNYEVTPAESFYGNATIVQQDCLELKIPIRFPRQRIYYGRVSEAFGQWNALVNFEYHRAYYLSIGEAIGFLAAAIGIEEFPSLPCCSLPEPTWRELSIREAYFNPVYGCQYEFEVSWLSPVAFSDYCGTFYDGTSKQTDGDKDGGLPPNGIFPVEASDPKNPYAGLPPTTPDSEQGGFSNSTVNNIDDVDPDNKPKIRHRCLNGECIPDEQGGYASLSECEAALIRTGNWQVRYTYYDPAAGCSTSDLAADLVNETNPNDVFSYTDVVPTSFSCVGTGATQGNFRKNGVVFSSPSSLSNVSFVFVQRTLCP